MVKPEVGDLFIFPGTLYHCVYPFYGSGERRSFSMNFQVILDEKGGSTLFQAMTAVRYKRLKGKKAIFEGVNLDWLQWLMTYEKTFALKLNLNLQGQFC